MAHILFTQTFWALAFILIVAAGTTLSAAVQRCRGFLIVGYLTLMALAFWLIANNLYELH